MSIEKIIFGKYRFISHIFFWVVAWCFLLVMFGHQYGNYTESLLFVSVIFAVSVATTYFTLYYLIPEFLLKKRYAYFFLYAFYGLIISVYLELMFSLIYVVIITEFNKLLSPTVVDIFFLIFGTYIIVISASVIKMVKFWFLENNKSERINKERVEAELRLLKSQINPHFLFNTLNNIYALALEKSDSTPHAVIKLSKILDYLLYECNDSYVLLEKEINVIQDYIELEKIRYGKKVIINFLNNNDQTNLKIAPNLLLPFIENAFKHGVSRLRSNAYVNISINYINQELVFIVENNKNKQKKENIKSSGIGLQNIRKRLNLIYAKNYKLDIVENSTLFRINLNVKLNEIDEN